MGECFPRTTDLPGQSPLFWVAQKDRYLRQLLIKDIEAETGRRLIVYYTDCGVRAQIDGFDCKYFAELLGVDNSPFDLFIETNGGQTDATENIVSILMKAAPGFRVIVPSRAKSNGTLIALASDEIVMGNPSELGPIDPNLVFNNQSIPCSFIVTNKGADPLMIQYADAAIKQTAKLAGTVLAQRMMKGKPPADIGNVVAALATKNQYHSHGSVIDWMEAASLGLVVRHMPPDSPLWQKLWLLRCMYEFDARAQGLAKIYESSKTSHSIRVTV